MLHTSTAFLSGAACGRSYMVISIEYGFSDLMSINCHIMPRDLSQEFHGVPEGIPNEDCGFLTA